MDNSNDNGNGAADVPVEQAIATALDALGPVVVDPATAPGHLHLLAMAYDNVERARIVCESQQRASKTAKAALDQAVAHVLDLVRDATRPRALPLFDAVQAETDRDRMTAAAGG